MNSKRKGFAATIPQTLTLDYQICNIAAHAPFLVWQPRHFPGPGESLPMCHSERQYQQFLQTIPTDFDGEALFGNELDLSNQGNMQPVPAAQLFRDLCGIYQHIRWVAPGQSQGDISNGSPWLSEWLSTIKRLGVANRVTIAASHWYDYDPLRRDITWMVNTVGAVYTKYLRPIPLWITELGTHWWYDGRDFQWPESFIMPQTWDTEEKRQKAYCPTWPEWIQACHAMGYTSVPIPPGVARFGRWLRQARANPWATRYFIYTNRSTQIPYNNNEYTSHHAMINPQAELTMLGQLLANI